MSTPPDWGEYYRTCTDCGYRYHASEGGCECYLYCDECGEEMLTGGDICILCDDCAEEEGIE